MGLLKGLQGLLAFLTIFPVKADQDSLLHAARHMYLFPVVGLMIGTAAGFFAFPLFLTLPSTIAATFSLAFLYLLTGLHHVDGLLDFGDGLMVKGTANKRIEAMRDTSTGVGGWALATLTFVTSVFLVSELGLTLIIQALIAAEITAKFSMVFLARMGRIAAGGISAPFIDAMKGRRGTMLSISSLGLTAAFLIPIFGSVIGAIIIAAGIVTSLLILAISEWLFEGVTGDIFGATNEIGRMAALLTMVILIT